MSALYQIQIQTIDVDALHAEVHLNADSSVFAGHFEQKPILPGAAMMVLTREVVEQALNVNLSLTTAGVVKFLAMISPEEIPFFDVYIQLHRMGDEMKCDTEFKWEEKSLFKYKSQYKIEQ